MVTQHQTSSEIVTEHKLGQKRLTRVKKHHNIFLGRLPPPKCHKTSEAAPHLAAAGTGCQQHAIRPRHLYIFIENVLTSVDLFCIDLRVGVALLRAGKGPPTHHGSQNRFPVQVTGRAAALGGNLSVAAPPSAAHPPPPSSAQLPPPSAAFFIQQPLM